MSAVAPRAGGAARGTSPKPAGASRERQMRQSEDRAVTTTTDKVKKRLLPSAGPTRGGVLPSMLLRRAELLRRSELLRRGGVGGGNPQSLSVSCASEASNDSFCSRASTGRIGRPVGPPGGAARWRAAGLVGPPSARPVARKAASVVPDGAAAPPAAAMVVGSLNGEAATAGLARCPWVTPNTGRWSKPIMCLYHLLGKTKTKEDANYTVTCKMYPSLQLYTV